MLKVNTEKILSEYNEILQKREIARQNIRAEAEAFAARRGYNTQQVEDFVAYVLDTENDGLTLDEVDLLEVLERYIVEVENVEANGEVVY